MYIFTICIFIQLGQPIRRGINYLTLTRKVPPTRVNFLAYILQTRVYFRSEFRKPGSTFNPFSVDQGIKLEHFRKPGSNWKHFRNFRRPGSIWGVKFPLNQGMFRKILAAHTHKYASAPFPTPAMGNVYRITFLHRPAYISLFIYIFIIMCF